MKKMKAQPDICRGIRQIKVRTSVITILIAALPFLGTDRLMAADEQGGAPEPSAGVRDPAADRIAGQPALTERATLVDYRVYAETYNPELRAARLRQRAALERIPQARALPDPQLEYRFEDMGGGFDSWEHQLMLSQMFPWFGKRGLMGGEAGVMADIEEQMYQEMRLRLYTMVTEAYTEYYYLRREITVTEENLKLLTYLERVAQARYTVGKGSQSDVIKAQVEMGILEERIQSLRDMLRSAAARLNSVLNRPVDAPLSDPSELPDVEITLTEEQLIRLLEENNPSLRAAALQAERGERAFALAQREYYPDIMVGVGLMSSRENMFGAMGSRRNSLMGMLSLNLPLRVRRNRAAMNEAQALQRSAEQTRDNRENELKAELQEALYRWRDSERKVRLYRDSLLPKARQSLAVSQRAYEAGSIDFLDLVDAQRMLLELELSLQRARSDRVQSYAVIVQLTGREPLTAE
ncbi:MAG: TolC family protein [Candidatus Latescibacterota bacterium]